MVADVLACSPRLTPSGVLLLAAFAGDAIEMVDEQRHLMRLFFESAFRPWLVAGAQKPRETGEQVRGLGRIVSPGVQQKAGNGLDEQPSEAAAKKAVNQPAVLVHDFEERR